MVDIAQGAAKGREMRLYKADDATKECPVCNGTGKIREGHVKCPAPPDGCGGTGTVPSDFEKRRNLQKAVNAAHEFYKRDFDPNVGGGVDRDQIPAEDFAGPNRSFPIVIPKDVADAAASLGRANGPTAPIKAKIISIAQRKGPSFVAQLPDAWGATSKTKKASYTMCGSCAGKGMTGSGAVCTTCGGTGVGKGA